MNFQRFGLKACVLAFLAVWMQMARAQAVEVDAQAQAWLRAAEVVMTPGEIARWAIERNAKAIAQRAQVASVSELVEAERSLYDPVMSVTTSRTFNKQARPSQDISADVQRLISCGLDPECQGSISDLKLEDRQLATVHGYGVQVLLPSGAQLEVRHSVQGNRSNLSDPPDKMEARASLTLSVVQPLLRGGGRDATEADLAVAEREYGVELQNLSRQVLDTLGSAVGAYWQLYQSEKTVFWREEALHMAQAAVDEVVTREQAGYGNTLELADAKLALNARRNELVSAVQQHAELQARVRNLLNLPGSAYAAVKFKTAASVLPVVDAPGELEQSKALDAWPAYRIALLREEQERIRLSYANNQRQPDLSLAMTYSQNNLMASRKKAFEDVADSKNRGWSLGVTFSRPLFNSAAEHKYGAQSVKVKAATQAVQSELVAWSNELVARESQLKATGEQVKVRRDAVALREQALAMQQAQFDAGRARMRTLLERQDQLSDSRLQSIEAEINWKLAELQLLAATGDVLERFGISVQTR